MVNMDKPHYLIAFKISFPLKRLVSVQPSVKPYVCPSFSNIV